MGSRLHGLDALRGIAALIVAWHHLQAHYGFVVVQVAAISAVDLFLVLSGFVMARTYEPKLPHDFVWLRYRRLFPTMAIGAVLGLIVSVVKFGFSYNVFYAFVAILAFLPWPFMGLFAVNLPAWSLFSEITANILHRLVFANLRNWWLGALIVMLALVFGLATFATDRVAWGNDGLSLTIATVRSLCCYLIGMAVWRAYGDRSLGSPAVALAGLPALLMIGTHTNPLVFSIGFALVGAPLILRMGIGLGPSFAAKLSGAASFPLYALHFPIIVAGAYFGLPPALTFALCIGAAAALVGAQSNRKGLCSRLQRTARA